MNRGGRGRGRGHDREFNERHDGNGMTGCRRIATADDCNDIHEVVMSRVLSHPFERMGKEESTRSLPQTC